MSKRYKTVDEVVLDGDHFVAVNTATWEMETYNDGEIIVMNQSETISCSEDILKRCEFVQITHLTQAQLQLVKENIFKFQ